MDVTNLINSEERCHKDFITESSTQRYEKEVLPKASFLEEKSPTMINVSLNETSQKTISAEPFTEEISSKRKKIYSNIVKEISQGIEESINQHHSDDVSSQSEKTTLRYGYKTVKKSYSAANLVSKNIIKSSSLSKNLILETKSGNLTKKEASDIFLRQEKTILKRDLTSFSQTAGKALIHSAEDFNEGDDSLGMDVIRKPKNTLFHTYRTFETASLTKRNLSVALKKTQKISSSTVNFAQRFFRKGKKIFKNPLVIKSSIVVLSVLLVISFIITMMSAIVSSLPSLSVKSETLDITQTYAFVTELDAKMNGKIKKLANTSGIDKFHFYLNGQATTLDSLKISTNADKILMFLDSKYEDYSYDFVIEEIKEIHEYLYTLTWETWTTGSKENKKKHLGIYLQTKSLDEYIDNSLDKDQKEMYLALEEMGAYTMRAEIGSPFEADWYPNITERYGWRFHPIKQNLQLHHAVDIGMPLNTPVYACTSGKAVIPGYSSSYGNYIKVVDGTGNYTLYAHLNSLAVSNGSKIKAGTVIGYVGSTGQSTGPHLHLEYYYDGEFLNPTLVMERNY